MSTPICPRAILRQPARPSRQHRRPKGRLYVGSGSPSVRKKTNPERPPPSVIRANPAGAGFLQHAGRGVAYGMVGCGSTTSARLAPAGEQPNARLMIYSAVSSTSPGPARNTPSRLNIDHTEIRSPCIQNSPDQCMPEGPRVEKSSEYPVPTTASEIVAISLVSSPEAIRQQR